VPEADGAGDEPGAPAPYGRASVPRGAAVLPGAVRGICGGPGAVCGRGVISPARQGRRAPLRALGGERGHGGANLPSAGRAPARGRAGGRQGQAVPAECVARTAGPRTGATRGRGARPAGTPADSAGYRSLELRPPGGRRKGIVQASRRVRRRFLARGGGGHLRARSGRQLPGYAHLSGGQQPAGAAAS
jgi:hypothetical protein